MKIERISDNQIRCTLTAKDLEERHIRLSELAYGSEKAKALFRDLMTAAMREYGFTNEQNIPLMIEAVPDRGNQLILTITKVEDPEELDTRFARFSPTKEVADPQGEPEISGADDILDVFRKLKSTLKNAARNAAENSTKEKDPGRAEETGSAEEAGAAEDRAAAKTPAQRPRRTRNTRTQDINLARLYTFTDLDTLIDAAAALGGFYEGVNSLYRMRATGEYRLAVHQSGHSPEDFNRICNVLTEYGKGENWTAPAEAHLAELEEHVLMGNALQKLSALKNTETEETLP